MRNERRNSILMMRHYPGLGNASDWSCRVGNFASTNQKRNPDLRRHVTANEQARQDARLRGGSIIKPCAEVPREKESRSDDVTY